MRAAIIVNSLRFGGAEVQTVELANNLSARGYDILLMSMDSETGVRERISPGVRVEIVDKKIYLDVRALFKIIRLLKEFQPQALLTVNSYSAMYGYLASIFTGRRFKLVSVQHTTLFQGIVDAIQNTYYTGIIKRMDRVVFVSGNQRLHWLKTFKIKPEKTVVIYNGIDIERFEGFRADRETIRAGLGIGPSEIVIGINANFRPEKKHEDMVDALEALRSEGYPVRLLFIGDGVRRKYLEKYISEKKLSEYVIITGFVQDVRPYLSCVDISALTSTAVETLSIAIIESMALGKPVLLSDIGGASELVDSGKNGLLYKAGNVGQLVDALKEMIDGNQLEAMGKNSADKARRLFNRINMTDKYAELLES